MAPKYRNGRIAAPFVDWTNDASRFDTLWALAGAGNSRTAISNPIAIHATTRMKLF